MDEIIFWLYKPSEIYKSLNLFPNKNSSKEENLNILTRILIIIFIIQIFFNYIQGNTFTTTTFIPLLLIFFIVVFYIMSSKNQENFFEHQYNNFNDIDNLETSSSYHRNLGLSNIIENNINESDCYKCLDVKGCDPKHLPYQGNGINFQNDSGDIQPCNVDDSEIEVVNMVDEIANQKMFKNVSDSFESKNFDRTFLTVPPRSDPPNTIDLAYALYGNMPSCKVDQAQCLKYDFLDQKGGYRY